MAAGCQIPRPLRAILDPRDRDLARLAAPHVVEDVERVLHALHPLEHMQLALSGVDHDGGGDHVGALGGGALCKFGFGVNQPAETGQKQGLFLRL